MFFLIISYVTPKLRTLFTIWYFIIDISYTIHLLINSFLVLDKHFVDLILVHSLLISLQLCCFCMQSLFELLSLFLFHFPLCYTSFQVPHLFLSSLSLLFGDVLVSKLYLLIFLIPLFHQGSNCFLFLLQQALKPIFFPT